MAVVTAGHNLSKSLATTANLRQSSPPIHITTNPSHVSTLQLQTLYSLCSHSVHRFPHSAVRHIDLNKLRIALSHSDVVVSVFAHKEVVSWYGSGRGGERKGGGNEWLRRWGGMPEAWGGELVGFGRAVSDCALTASIHDVMWLPGSSSITRNGNWPDDRK